MVVRFGCYGRILRFFDTLILDKNTLLSFCGDIVCTVQSNYSTRNFHALNKTNRKTGRVFKLNGSILCAKLWNVWFGIKTFVRLLIETAILISTIKLYSHRMILTEYVMNFIQNLIYLIIQRPYLVRWLSLMTHLLIKIVGSIKCMSVSWKLENPNNYYTK